MNKLERLKQTKDSLEHMLFNKSNSEAAKEIYRILTPYFKKIDQMKTYQPIDRVRLARLFLESDLSQDSELLSCYGRFANLVEGIEV